VASKLLTILGFDDNDPEVDAGRRHGATIARLLDALVQIREKRGLTQTRVAELMDTTQSSVSNFERQGGDPKVSTLLRYADAVGAEIDFMVTDPVISITRSVVAGNVEAGMASRYQTSAFEVAVS
jgi:transcriptional regulator with XRE-family HTH domain